MARTRAIHALLNEHRIDPFALCDELGVGNDSASEAFVLKGVVPIKDDETDFAAFQKAEVLRSVFPVFGEHHFGLGVPRDVFAGLNVVRGVDADGNAPREETPEESKTPFRSIESDDVYRGEFAAFERDERLRESDAFRIILAEVYRFLLYVSLTQTPVCFEESAGRSGNCRMTRRNSSIKVVGGIADGPSFPKRIGSSVLKSSVQRIFLVG